MLVSDQLLTWSDENTESRPPPPCESAAKRSCANCPRSKLSCAVLSSSATNAVASPAANAPTAPVMAPSTICR